MRCDPSNEAALGDLKYLQFSEHVGRLELLCEAKSLRIWRGDGTYARVEGKKSKKFEILPLEAR